MPATKAEATINRARSVARHLDAIGDPKRANDVRALCCGNSSYRTLVTAQQKEIAELRAALADKVIRHVRSSGQ